MLFGAAAQRIPLSLLGILQYIAPTMHLIIGVVVFGEAVSSGEWFGFVLVWIALIIYTVDTSRAAASIPWAEQRQIGRGEPWVRGLAHRLRRATRPLPVVDPDLAVRGHSCAVAVALCRLFADVPGNDDARDASPDTPQRDETGGQQCGKTHHDRHIDRPEHHESSVR